jgi:chaperonin GroES
MKTIQPSPNNVFCERQRPQESTQSGIIIPPSAQDETQFATVIASGSDIYQSGDVIVYKEYTTTDIILDEKPYFLIDTVDILGKLVND